MRPMPRMKEPDMSIRTALLASLLAFATVPIATALADELSPRTVSVSGQGEVPAQPDLAYVTLGVAGPATDHGRGTQGGRDHRGASARPLQGP